MRPAHVGALRFRADTPVWLDEYRLVAGGEPTTTAVAGMAANLPPRASLEPAHPNPDDAGRALATGVYVVRLRAGGDPVGVRKLLLLR